MGIALSSLVRPSMTVKFSVLIHQSITHPGQYLLSVVNTDDETLPLHKSTDLSGLISAASECFCVDEDKWTYNNQLKCYTLDIDVPDA